MSVKTGTRPANVTPWAIRRRGDKIVTLLASVIPAALSWYIMKQVRLSSFTTVTLVFLPLQVISGAIATGINRGRRRASDGAMNVVIVFLAALVVVLLGSVVESVIRAGHSALTSQFLFYNDTYITPATDMKYGGVGHAIVGSAIIVGGATLASVPLGLLVAIYLTETRGRMRNVVRFLSQSMSGLPSVVAGLFIYSMLVVTQVSRPSGILGSLALLILMLPTVVRTAEEVLKLVPGDLRSAALALGSTRVRVFFQVTLPVARSGLVTAVLLGVARIVGETAPLLLTSGLSKTTALNPLSGPMSTLTSYAYTYLASGYDSARERAWGSALVLLMLVGLLFAVARILGSKKVAR